MYIVCTLARYTVDICKYHATKIHPIYESITNPTAVTLNVMLLYIF